MADRRLEITDVSAAWLDRLNTPPDAVAAILREHADHPRAQMMTHPDVGRLLATLVRITGGRRALEIGTFVGVSAVWIAGALAPDGILDTLEIDDETADIAERNVARSSMADRVRVHRGPALQTLARFGDAAYDLAYIDADKPGYPAYLEESARLVRPGGVIVADNPAPRRPGSRPGQPRRERAGDARRRAPRRVRSAPGDRGPQHRRRRARRRCRGIAAPALGCDLSRGR